MRFVHPHPPERRSSQKQEKANTGECFSKSITSNPYLRERIFPPLVFQTIKKRQPFHPRRTVTAISGQTARTCVVLVDSHKRFPLPLNPKQRHCAQVYIYTTECHTPTSHKTFFALDINLCCSFLRIRPRRHITACPKNWTTTTTSQWEPEPRLSQAVEEYGQIDVEI